MKSIITASSQIATVRNTTATTIEIDRNLKKELYNLLIHCKIKNKLIILDFYILYESFLLACG